MESKFVDYEKKILDFQQKGEEVKQKLKSMDDEKIQILRLGAEQEEKISELVKERENLVAQAAALASSQSNADDQAKLDEEIKLLKDELEVTRTECNKLKSEHIVLNSSIAESKNELTKNHLEMNALKEKQEKLSQELDMMTKDKTKLEDRFKEVFEEKKVVLAPFNLCV